MTPEEGKKENGRIQGGGSLTEGQIQIQSAFYAFRVGKMAGMFLRFRIKHCQNEYVN